MRAIPAKNIAFVLAAILAGIALFALRHPDLLAEWFRDGKFYNDIMELNQ